MAQPYINLPNVYRFRIRKQSVADPTDEWFNEWDVRYPNSALPPGNDTIATDLITFETKIHYASVRLVSLDIYDYHVGTPPGGPGSTFAASFPIGVIGTKNAGGWAGAGARDIGGEVCVMVSKLLQFTRRASHNFYRGCLQDQDVKAEAGAEWVYNTGEPDVAGFNTIVAATIGQHLQNVPSGTAPVFVRVHQTKSGTPKLVTALNDTTIFAIQLALTIATNKISRKSKR